MNQLTSVYACRNAYIRKCVHNCVDNGVILPSLHLSSVDYRRGETTRKLFSVDLPFKCEAPKISMSPDGRVVALGLDHSMYVYSCEDGELMEAMEHVYQSKRTCIEFTTCICSGCGHREESKYSSLSVLDMKVQL